MLNKSSNEFNFPPAHHLQLVCLANGHHICLKDVQTLVHVNKSDVRQSIHDLQLWTMSGSSSQICDCLENRNKVCLKFFLSVRYYLFYD